MKVNKRVSLLFVPAEYIRTWPTSSPYSTLNNVTARFGIVLPLKC